MSSGTVTSGERSRRHRYSFSSVLSRMYGQRLHAQLSSMPGAWISVLLGRRASAIWWKTPSSVPMMSVFAGDSIARSMIFLVDPMKSACSSTAVVALRMREHLGVGMAHA